MLSLPVLLLLLTLFLTLTSASSLTRLSPSPSTPSTPTPSPPRSHPRLHTNFHLELERQYAQGLRQRPQQTGNVTSHTISQPLDHLDHLNPRALHADLLAQHSVLGRHWAGVPLGWVGSGRSRPRRSSTAPTC